MRWIATMWRRIAKHFGSFPVESDNEPIVILDNGATVLMAKDL